MPTRSQTARIEALEEWRSPYVRRLDVRDLAEIPEKVAALECSGKIDPHGGVLVVPLIPTVEWEGACEQQQRELTKQEHELVRGR